MDRLAAFWPTNIAALEDQNRTSGLGKSQVNTAHFGFIKLLTYYHFLRSGDFVALFPEIEQDVDAQLPPEPSTSFTASIVEMSNTYLFISFIQARPVDISSTPFRVEITNDDVIYRRMISALSLLACDAAAQREDTRRNWEQLDPESLTVKENIVQGTELRDILIPSFGRPRRGSELLGNQLLRSWVERYRRPIPFRLDGDPDLGLNDSQLRAVASSLGERATVIQGVRSLLSASGNLQLFVDLYNTF
jgi:hypothetical protein